MKRACWLNTNNDEFYASSIRPLKNKLFLDEIKILTLVKITAIYFCFETFHQSAQG